MRIYLSPQSNNEKIAYSFNGEIISATYKGITDTFDFTSLSDGQIQDISIMQTKLEINPIINAERKDGVLNIQLLNFIGVNATEEEKFPNWKDAQ